MQNPNRISSEITQLSSLAMHRSDGVSISYADITQEYRLYLALVAMRWLNIASHTFLPARAWHRIWNYVNLVFFFAQFFGAIFRSANHNVEQLQFFLSVDKFNELLLSAQCPLPWRGLNDEDATQIKKNYLRRYRFRSFSLSALKWRVLPCDYNVPEKPSKRIVHVFSVWILLLPQWSIKQCVMFIVKVISLSLFRLFVAFATNSKHTDRQ